MPRIRDLTAAQLAQHAMNVFLFMGTHRTGARLTYHALCLDPRNGIALRCLSDLLAESGFPGAAGAVLEHALDPALGLDEATRETLDQLRFMCKWWWGFSRHETGLTSLSFEELKDRKRFTVDEERWRAFVGEAVNRAGSLDEAVRAAQTLLGAVSGLLAHRELGAKASMDECVHPDRFERTADYETWLDEPTSPLDDLERQRQEKSGTT